MPEPEVLMDLSGSDAVYVIPTEIINEYRHCRTFHNGEWEAIPATTWRYLCPEIIRIWPTSHMRKARWLSSTVAPKFMELLQEAYAPVVFQSPVSGYCVQDLLCLAWVRTGGLSERFDIREWMSEEWPTQINEVLKMTPLELNASVAVLLLGWENDRAV